MDNTEDQLREKDEEITSLESRIATMSADHSNNKTIEHLQKSMEEKNKQLERYYWFMSCSYTLVVAVGGSYMTAMYAVLYTCTCILYMYIPTVIIFQTKRAEGCRYS